MNKYKIKPADSSPGMLSGEQYIGSAVEILHKVGTIRRIEGSTAMIERPFYRRLLRVSLFELEVIE